MDMGSDLRPLKPTSNTGITPPCTFDPTHLEHLRGGCCKRKYGMVWALLCPNGRKGQFVAQLLRSPRLP